MTYSYKTIPNTITKNKKYNNKYDVIIAKNMDDYDDFAEFDFLQPNINLVSSKGPNNFFIPNIWIEEYQ